MSCQLVVVFGLISFVQVSRMPRECLHLGHGSVWLNPSSAWPCNVSPRKSILRLLPFGVIKGCRALAAASTFFSVASPAAVSAAAAVPVTVGVLAFRVFGAVASMVASFSSWS